MGYGLLIPHSASLHICHCKTYFSNSMFNVIQQSRTTVRDTWLVWPPQHHHSSRRLLPRILGSSPSPCQSASLVAPGDPLLPFPASSPSENTVVQSWARADGKVDETPLPPNKHCFLFTFFFCYLVREKENLASFLPFPSETLCSQPLNLSWVRVWEKNRLKKHKKHTQGTRRSLCTLSVTLPPSLSPFLPLPTLPL